MLDCILGLEDARVGEVHALPEVDGTLKGWSAAGLACERGDTATLAVLEAPQAACTRWHRTLLLRLSPRRTSTTEDGPFSAVSTLIFMSKWSFCAAFFEIYKISTILHCSKVTN